MDQKKEELTKELLNLLNNLESQQEAKKLDMKSYAEVIKGLKEKVKKVRIELEK